METTRKIFSGEYKMIHKGIERMIQEQEATLHKLEDMIKDPQYIYMTKEVSWKYIDPVNNNIDSLYRLKEKLTSKKETFFINE